MLKFSDWVRSMTATRCLNLNTSYVGVQHYKDYEDDPQNEFKYILC